MTNDQLFSNTRFLYEKKLLELIKSIQKSSSGGESEQEDIKEEIEEIKGDVDSIKKSLSSIKDTLDKTIATRKDPLLFYTEVYTSNTSISDTVNGSVYNSGNTNITVNGGTIKPGMTVTWDSDLSRYVKSVNVTIPTGGEATICYTKA